jgi:hypothetical protein
MTARSDPRCPNDNHGRTIIVVRHCPNCGDIVNATIPKKMCAHAVHAMRRRKQHCYCVDCGAQLRTRL